MAYAGIAEFRRGAWDAIKRTLDFRSRSRRTELIGFYLASLLVGIIASFGLSFIGDPVLAQRLTLALNWAILTPLVGLLVRRLHDQGRTGKLAWILAVPVLYTAIGDLSSTLGGIEQRIATDRILAYAYWPMLGCAMSILVVYFLPGTIGPNRFGPDPRGRE